MYTLSERASSNDVIKIDNQNLEIPHTCIINASSPLFENITLTGINGRPKIRGKNLTFDIHLFHEDVKRTQRNLTHITIRVEDIWLTKTGIVRVYNTSSTLNVQIINSTVSELMHRNTVSVIDSKAKRTIIMINNSLLNNIKRGICLKNFHNEIKIIDSKVLYDDQKKFFGPECPQLIVTNDFMSLSATFINSRFKTSLSHRFTIN